MPITNDVFHHQVAWFSLQAAQLNQVDAIEGY
jgi:hypothetical protein